MAYLFTQVSFYQLRGLDGNCRLIVNAVSHYRIVAQQSNLHNVDVEYNVWTLEYNIAHFMLNNTF